MAQPNQGTKSRKRKSPPAKRPFIEQFLDRIDLLWTIILDLAVIVAAVGATRLAIVWTDSLSADIEITWALILIRFIADVGMVGTVGLITFFDLAKRGIQGYRRLREVWNA